MEGWGVTSGPLNNDLLFLGSEHRAAHYFHNPGSDAGIIRTRRGDTNFWRLIQRKPIPYDVKKYIKKAGFGGIIDCGNRKLDRGLITALVERWRPETHTFHLPVGECTVTLQDVQVLWGLKVDGDAISGTDVVLEKQELILEFHRLTGCILPDEATDGHRINLVAIYNQIEKEFPENYTDEQCQKRARLIILYLIGATIFPDSASNWLHANFLTHVENLEDCGQLSWGSATLAWLYKQLCKATKMTARDVGGPLFLLQLWAWERLPSLAPINNRPINFDLPYGARWQGGELSYVSTTSHCLSAYRSSLHSLNNNMFNWTPYADNLRNLPSICTNGHSCWISDTYLICWEIVEPHCASRVLRQFGMVQPIPTSVLLRRDEHVRLHGITRKGGRNRNWIDEHRFYNESWNSRRVSVVRGSLTNTTNASEEYMRWYMERTVTFVTNPTHQVPNPHGFQNDGQLLTMMRQGMSQFYQMPGNEIVNNLAGYYMNFSHADHGAYLPAHVIENPVHVEVPHVPERITRRARGRGRGRGRGRVGGQVVEEWPFDLNN